jgi:predicted nucleic acid-binding protein
MAITHLLDMSILSQSMKGVPIQAALDHWNKVGMESVCTSAICLAEMKRGSPCDPLI